MTRPSDPTVEAVPLSACPVCGGEGRVYRMTPAYEAMATQAAGGSFGWTGPTHEWRACRPCHGTGLATLDRSTVPDEGALRAAAREVIKAHGLYGPNSPEFRVAFGRLIGKTGDKAEVATPKDEPDAPPHSQLREALEEAIEGLLATPRPPSSGPAEGIKAWELAHWRLVTAYGAYRGDHEMCPVPSSVTGQPCLLRAGHPQDSADRFHRYAAATPKDEPDAPLDVERLMRTMRYHPHLRGKQGDYADGWDAATRTVIDLLSEDSPHG